MWAIKADRRSDEKVDPVDVNRFTKSNAKAKGVSTEEIAEDAVAEPQDPESPDAIWRQQLHRALTTVLDPAAFERLAMRLLRESGFVHVEVTGRTGDGGIDGKPPLRSTR